MKRQANPLLSLSGEHALAQYEQALREQEDLTPVSIRNYLSDLRHFITYDPSVAVKLVGEGETTPISIRKNEEGIVRACPGLYREKICARRKTS